MREIQTVADGPVFLTSKGERDCLEIILQACEEGVYLTTKQIAERSGLTERHVRNILRKTNLQAAMRFLAENSLIPIFSSLIKNAMQGKTKSQELYFQLLGMIKTNHESIINVLNINVPDEKFLSEKEIDELLGRGKK